MKKQPDISLEPASSRARSVMLVLTIGLPFFTTCIALAMVAINQHPKVNQIGNNFLLTALGTLLLVLLLTSVLWYFLNVAMNKHRVEWHNNSFEVLTSFYKQRYSRRDLLLDAAKIVDLEIEKNFRPFLKTNGYAVPGFKSGWFRLRNKQSAFCAIGSGTRVLMLPTNKGHCLMLGTTAPERVLEQLKQWALEA